jgi:hypothetical protein
MLQSPSKKLKKGHLVLCILSLCTHDVILQTCWHFSYQSEFFLKPESEEFGGEWEVGFKFWNLANFVKDWWSEG